MADNVQWIKLKVGMFDGNSFKKIKRAKIGGINYRDKLTAIWFELLDLAGKGNAKGYLVDNNEIPFETYEDIAIMLDRETQEIELCMAFYLKEKMVELIDNVYCLTNFLEYQNQEGLEKIREQKRLRQARWRERKSLGLVGNVDENASTTPSTMRLPSISISNSIYNEKEYYNNLLSYLKDDCNIIYERHQSKVNMGKLVCVGNIMSMLDEIQARYSIEEIRECFKNANKSYPVQPKYKNCDFAWLLNNLDEFKTASVSGTQGINDIDFLIAKGFSKEWVMALSEEERAEKRKKWEK